MTTRNRTLVLSSLTLAALLAACSSTPLPPQGAAPVETRNAAGPAAAGAQGTAPSATAAATPQSRVATVDLAAQQAAASSRALNASAVAAAAVASSSRVVYFDFDSFVIKDEFKPTIDNFAAALRTDKARKLTVEGHTDDRGGREYNLALGQKRAEAVVKSIALLTGSDNQVEAVSFGEERPATSGKGEEAWAKNRRAELKDR